LIEKYKFNIDVLSRLLDVKKEVILIQDEKKLYENSKDFSRMSNIIFMLELSGKDDAKTEHWGGKECDVTTIDGSIMRFFQLD